MDVRKFIVKVKQILMLCSVTDDSGRKLLAAVYRIIESKGKASAFYVIFNVGGGVHGYYTREIFPQTAE